MAIVVRRSGFTVPLSLVVLTSTAMLLAGCQSGGASDANQQGTAGSSSSVKAQSTASAKSTSGQKPDHASPRIPSPSGKGAESSSPQSSASTSAHPSSPRASEPRPAANGAASSGATKASTQNGGASKASEPGGSTSRPSGPQVDTSQSTQPAAPDTQALPGPAQPADNSDGAGTTAPAPAPAGPATSFVSDSLVSEKTAMIVSPSGNIGCDLSANYAGCGVLSYRSNGTFGHDTAGSPKWWFNLSSGATPQISGRGEGAFSLDESFRGGDSPSPQVVEYGQSVVFGSWVCSSEETGMTCRNTETGHGVFLSSARYEVF